MKPLGFDFCSMPHDDNTPRQLFFECPVARCRAPWTSNPPRFCSQDCVAKHAQLNAGDHLGGVDVLAKLEVALEALRGEIRGRLSAVNGDPSRLSADDRRLYTKAAEAVHAIGRLRLAQAFGATDDIPAALEDVQRACESIVKP